MIRSELVEKIAAENPHLYQRDIERIIGTVFDDIIDAMSNGNRVELRGFGSFSVKQREARRGRNPRTGETVDVELHPAHSVTFDRETSSKVTFGSGRPLASLKTPSGAYDAMRN